MAEMIERTESQAASRVPVTKPKATNRVPGGWLVKVGQGYYTGNRRSEFERWTVFPQFAKVYQRQGWAQTMAERLGGHVVPAPASRHEKGSQA